MQRLPGSGINLEYFSYSAPSTSTPLTFLFIGRFLKDKGIIEYSQAATYLAKSHPNVKFKILGWHEESSNSISKSEFEFIMQQPNIELLEKVGDVRPIIRDCHVLVHPSYHEGMPRVVLEAMAIGRPIITADAQGAGNLSLIVITVLLFHLWTRFH